MAARRAQAGIPFVPPKTGRRNDLGGGGNEILTVYTPGMAPDAWKPNQAKLVKAGSDLVLQVHYTPNGKASKYQTRIGMVLAKEPPTERILGLAVSNARFVIPPDDPGFEVQARMRLCACPGTTSTGNWRTSRPKKSCYPGTRLECRSALRRAEQGRDDGGIPGYRHPGLEHG